MTHILMLLAVLPPTSAPEIHSRETGKSVTVAQLAVDLAKRNVIFLGEEHDNTAGHKLQLQILQALHKLRPDLVVSMEQFERDTQGVLDDYLKGRIDEPAFLKQARPWSNYRKHYRAIVEFAREKKLDVIASNVPRRIARVIAKGEEPPRADAMFCPRTTTAPKDRYWELFVDVMTSHGGTGKPKEMERYYKSQCCKDDAMAEAVTDYLTRHPHRKPLIVHLCGKFHSDYGLGTAMRVLTRRPLLHIGVVTMEAVDDVSKVKNADWRDRAHFALIVPKEKSRKKPKTKPGKPSKTKTTRKQSRGVSPRAR